MEKILALNNLLKNAFSEKRNFILFPFALVALLASVTYYIFSPFYMLFDFAVLKLRKELYDDDKICNGAQIVKFIIAYPFFFLMSVLHIFAQGILAVGYFIISLAFCISSLKNVGKDLFLFHKI